MKKTIAILLALAVVLMGLAACGKTNETTQTVTDAQETATQTNETESNASVPDGEAPDGEAPGQPPEGGPGGHGILSLFPGLNLRPDILMGTLSKAIGSEGGFVCASHEMTDYLRNKARSYIFSTAPSPASAAAALAALGIIRTEPERVARLQHNVAFFLKQLHRLGIKAQTESAIVPVIVGDSARALAAAESMRDDGIFVSAIRYPSVPEGTARLRLTVMASHTESDLVRCAVSLAKAIAG